MAVISVDFDGTLVEHKFPDIGQDVPGAVQCCKDLVAAGHKLILFTMRNDSEQGPYLTEALRWCESRGISIWAANDNPEQHKWTDSRKVYANYYIDDAALGCPLRDSFLVERRMVDWYKLRDIMIEIGLLQN